MFAATTTDTLSVADHALLKKAPSSVPACLDLLEPPISTSWVPDNSSLFIATESTVQRYEPTANILRDVYTYRGPGAIQSIASRDKNTVIFAAENDVHVLDCSGSDTKITQTFASHGSPITSISLSNDATLLASSSTGQVHVHNLSLGSHTVLRGLASTKVDCVVFHPHSRTRLLVALDRQIFVYDTTRPSAPLKIIALSDATAGDIISVACSPFSKTLVATATSEGSVALLDLEKEKSLVRTVNMKVPLSTIDFTTEGGAMYLGTNTGKVLILDLRLLDKPPKSIVISQHGSPIKTISVQKKAKVAADSNTKTPTTNVMTKTKAPVEPLPSGRRATSSASTQSLKAAPKVAPSPARARVGKLPSTATPIQRRGPSALKEGAPAGSPTAGKIAGALRPKKVLSPSRDPLGNSLSGKIDELAEIRRGNKPTSTPVKASKPVAKEALSARPSPSGRATTLSTGKSKPTTSTTINKETRRTRTLPSSKTAPSLAPPSRKASTTISTSVFDHLAVPEPSNPPQRSRANSLASQAETERPPSVSGSSSAISSRSNRSNRPPTSTSYTSTSRPSSSASRPASSISRTSTLESIHTGASRRSVSSGSAKYTASRTPSPEFPEHQEPITPVAASKKAIGVNKKSGMSVLGLGTPEVDRWIEAGQQLGDDRGVRAKNRKESKGKGKTVGFKDEEDDDDSDDEEAKAERIRTLSLQISPRRPIPTSVSGSSVDSWAYLAANSPELSALSQNASPGVGAPASTQPSSAHDLLKTIVQDVMFDFQRESKSEMMGLHLDLLRMGRTWKTELRTLMDEYVGDLRELREENEKLRRENDRLRRSWA